MHWTIPATRWAGLRDVHRPRFPRLCTRLSNLTKQYSISNSPSSSCIIGPPEIYKPGLREESDNHNSITRSPFFQWQLYEEEGIRPLNTCLRLFGQCHIDHRKFHYGWVCLLDKSWKYDSLTTLKLIAFMKQHTHTITYGRQQFYISALWLHSYHPKTLACNVKVLSKFGSLKDWLEILYRIVNGPFVRKMEFMERKRVQRERQIKLMARRSGNDQDRVTKTEEEIEPCSREEKRIRMARHAVDLYRSDPSYRLLYDQISDVFADLLKSDLELLDSGEFGRISLASKWCPSLDSSYDRSTLFCESVARRLFPKLSCPEYRLLDEAHYAYKVRDRLRKQVLVPLRRALKLPEIYMSSNQWSSLPYDRVNMTALTTYKKLFIKHDKERFLQHIQENAKKQKAITGREKFPHELIGLLESGYDVEAQWSKMVEAFSQKGYFKNCCVVCRAYKMEWLPKTALNIMFSFQLLVSNLSDTPWKGTFLKQMDNENAEFLQIEEGDLQSKTECLRSHVEGCFVSLPALLDRILETAVSRNISREKMVRKLFVFCNLVFDENYRFGDCPKIEATRKKFENCGYVMPDLVVWNFGVGYASVELCGNGIISIRGTSPKIFEAFLEKDGKMEETTLMESRISGEDYRELKVLD